MTVQLPFDQANPLDTAPLLRELQAEGVVHRVLTRTGDPAWLVTGYEEVRCLLADERLGRSHPNPEEAARQGESLISGSPRGNYDTEQADHARQRLLMRPHFSPQRMRELQPRVEGLTTEMLDDLARHGPPADLSRALAQPLPVQVMCELLGVPYADRDRFRGWCEAVNDVTDRARSAAGVTELFGYGLRLVASKRSEPGEDIMSRMCAQGLDDNEIARLSMMLLFAGHVATVSIINLGILRLLTNPDEQRVLAQDPTRTAATVEEILRTPTQSGGISRYARTDLRIGDITVRAGDLVLLDVAAANHDPSVFPSPDRFDITRDGQAHLTFGYGIHYCIGAPLARLELQAIFSQLPAKFPTMRLAVPLEQLPMRSGVMAGSVAELPVEW
jgi:pentalenolactone synthase